MYRSPFSCLYYSIYLAFFPQMFCQVIQLVIDGSYRDILV